MIRILQISDIHFLSCEDEDDNYSQLRQRLLDDVDDLIGTRGDVDVILVCGDIANKGQREEYDKAHQFFKNPCSA
jgi:3',5'-cyclic AMP phosphodiesterase CpdA